MSIYKRGNAWYYDFQHHGQRYTGSIGAVSKTMAKEQLARQKAEVIEGRLNPKRSRKSPTFRQFAQEYLDWGRATKKPTTVLRNQKSIEVLMPLLGPKKLNAITPWSIEQFKKRRREAGLQPATINTELATLKAMLRKAREWGRMTTTPAAGVKKIPGAEHRTRFLSEEEEALLLPACSPALQRICLAALLSGLRGIELVSLRPEDVDLERNTLRVEAVYSKTGKGRTVPLGPRLHAVLTEALSVRGDAPVVFVTRMGESWTVGGFTAHE
jgi:integrase